MCKFCTDPQHPSNQSDLGRRQFLKAGTVGSVLAASAGLMASSVRASAQTNTNASAAHPGNGPYAVNAYAVPSAGAKFQRMQIERRALRPDDVLIDILYCGICHSDIHHVNNDWNINLYPCVPGHEIIGRVIAVGASVTKFKVGDIGGVGCMVDSCRECENCLNDREQNCVNGTTNTYDSIDRISGGHTFGGYSDKVVVKEHFVIRIPPGADLPAFAPILCAGVTTFSPMQHWRLERRQKVGVIGLGGLGHMALKLAVAKGANVTVFTTSPAKIADAKRMGAEEAILWDDAEAMKRLTGKFDLLISTVPQAYPMQQFVNVLKLDATLVNVGALEDLQNVGGGSLIFGRKSVAGSVIGGIAETQEVIDFCFARNIKSEIELIKPAQIDMAYQRVIDKDVRYRFVIDFSENKL